MRSFSWLPVQESLGDDDIKVVKDHLSVDRQRSSDELRGRLNVLRKVLNSKPYGYRKPWPKKSPGWRILGQDRRVAFMQIRTCHWFPWSLFLGAGLGRVNHWSCKRFVAAMVPYLLLP